jgi:hypothetical protein
LYQAILNTGSELNFDPEAKLDTNFLKNIFCKLVASKPIEKAVWKCLARAVYNDEKISMETFEPVSAREDYLTVCWEVARLNVTPFMKPLYANWLPNLKDILGNFQKLK